MQATKLDFNRPIFVIEHTVQSHWSTRHDPAKYRQYAADLAARISEECPGAIVLCNKVPKRWHEKPIYMQLIGNEDQDNDCYDMLPRSGAFEVSTVIE